MVGNLIYYRFINPAITAPDAFDIIDVGAGGSSLNNDQRKYLAFISKVVNFSASGKTVRFFKSFVALQSLFFYKNLKLA